MKTTTALVASCLACCQLSCAAAGPPSAPPPAVAGRTVEQLDAATKLRSEIHGGFRVKIYASAGDSGRAGLVAQGVLVIAPDPLTVHELSPTQVEDLRAARLLQMYRPSEDPDHGPGEDECRGCLAALNELADGLEPGNVCVAMQVEDGPPPHSFQRALAFRIARSRERGHRVDIDLLDSPDSSYGWSLERQGESIGMRDGGSESWFGWSNTRLEALPDSSIDFAACVDRALAISRTQAREVHSP